MSHDDTAANQRTCRWGFGACVDGVRVPRRCSCYAGGRGTWKACSAKDGVFVQWCPQQPTRQTCDVDRHSGACTLGFRVVHTGVFRAQTALRLVLWR